MSFPALQACLFDLDGVIVDTAKYHYLAWREIAAELGFGFREADNERLKGVSRDRSLEILLEIGGLTLDDRSKAILAAKKNNRYLHKVLNMTPGEILPGAKKFLVGCRNAGLKIGVVSASKNADTILKLLQIRDFFDAVVDGTMVEKTKPDPEAFLMGARDLGVASDVCAAYEDAAAGIAAANAAGMFSVGIGDRAVLKDADIVVSGLADLTIAVVIAERDRHARQAAGAAS